MSRSAPSEDVVDAEASSELESFVPAEAPIRAPGEQVLAVVRNGWRIVEPFPVEPGEA